MKKSVYTTSKIRTIGFVIIAAATFLTFVEIASPDAQAQLSGSTERPIADKAADGLNRAVQNIVNRRPSDANSTNASTQNRQTRNLGTDPDNYPSREDKDNEGSKNGNGLAEHGRKLGEVSAEMAEAAAQAALSNNDDKKDHGCGKTCGQDDNRSDDSSNDKKDDDGCKKTCGDKDETKDPEQTQTTTRRPPTNKPNEPHETRDNKHDHDDPDYNYEYNNYDYDYKTNNYYEDNKPKVQHSSTVHTRHDYPAATTSVKPHREPDYTHRDTATRAVVVQQQPAKEVHHHYTTVKDADDNYNAEVNVAAERDVKVETPKELPSTGPELPITLSLGGMVAALIARKFFGP